MSLAFPDQISSLAFRNPVLAAFATAIWHCSSAAEVSIVLNEAVRQAPRSTVSLQQAFDAAKNWPPERPPELTPATYQVIYSDGVTQESRLTPDEINSWAPASNKDAEGKFPYRILRIIDANGKSCGRSDRPADSTSAYTESLATVPSPELDPSKIKRGPDQALIDKAFLGLLN